MLYDFHTHSILSDGSLSPMELIYRSLSNSYKGIAITDHAGVGYLDRIVREIASQLSGNSVPHCVRSTKGRS